MGVEVNIDIEGVDQFKAAMAKLDSGMQRHVHRQLANWAADVKALARRMVPARTGHLRSSIYAKVQEWVADIGAEATYAVFVEFGTRYMRAKPYLYPAVQRCLPQLEAIVSQAIEDAKWEARL